MYGTVYENCTQPGSQCAAPCGYSPNTFALYTSPDLEAWTFVSDDILPEMRKDNARVDYWMPVVSRNPSTGQYIMQYWSGRCGFVKPCADIATAASPLGPFTMAPPLAVSAVPSSQMGLFVDADTGKAYVRYNTAAPQHHVAEQPAESRGAPMLYRACACACRCPLSRSGQQPSTRVPSLSSPHGVRSPPLEDA